MRQHLGIIALIALIGVPASAQRDEILTRDGIEFSVPAGAEIVDRRDVGGRETYVRLEGADLFVRVIRGGDYSAAPADQPATSTTMCGRPALRFEITIPALDAIGSRLDEHGIVEHLPPTHQPARVEVIVAFTLADGTPARLDWSVRADRRERYRARERAFFRSIRCRG